MKNSLNPKKFIVINFYKLLMGVLVFATLIAFLAYWLWWESRMAGGLLGSLAAGCLLVTIQFIIEWHAHGDVERLRKLQVRRILPHRDGKDYYAKLIDNAGKRIDILGVTANRFLEDFAHESRLDSQSLISALRRRVKVRILLPQRRHLEASQRSLFDIAKARMIELKRQFPVNFEFRYFNHPPSHSIVLAGDECLVGPVFPGIKSKDSPAIHSSSESALVNHYLSYFETEWLQAEHNDS